MAQRLKTDWILFAAILLMLCLGLVMVYSASSVVAELRYNETWYYFVRQLGFAVVSLPLMMYLKKFDYRRLHGPMWAFAGLGVVIALLIVVYFLDAKSHRWIRFGPTGLQPSEFAKPALSVFLASFLAYRMRVLNSRHTLLPVTLTLLLLAAVVGVADLGTAIVLVLTAAVVFFVAGLRRRFFLLAGLAVVLLACGAIAAKPYRLIRIIGFADPNHTLLDKLDSSGKLKTMMESSLSTRDTSYQARQSRIAIGTGGILGQGLMQGRQKFLYLPEAHTDFIYAVVGEELGLLGCLAVLGGFVVIAWRGMLLFRDVHDEFGRYLALAVSASLLIQALINISVVLDMGPTKGLTLPLISYGGSSLMSTLMSLGLLLSVSEHSG